jgi:DNA (cytosine-5)-methyltransferase 1
MTNLILSIFPGIGLLDHAFELEGYCVVRGPDAIWGGDVRNFHPPAGAFEGVIGGDPCQAHSQFSNLLRAKGLEPRFADMTSEFRRVIELTRPRWFLRENVPGAPELYVGGYGTYSFLLDNAWLGEAQMRKRRFWFGLRDAPPCNLRKWIPGVALELPRQAQTVTADHRAVPVKLGGSRKPKATAVQVDSVTGRHTSIGMGSAHPGDPPRYSVEEMLALQGLPEDFLAHCPFTAEGKRRAVGNGVPIPMGRSLAQAVKKATSGG